MIKIYKNFTLLLLTILVSGCAVYGTQFECKSGAGARCTSVSKVNQMIDKGEITDDDLQIKEQKNLQRSSADALQTKSNNTKQVQKSHKKEIITDVGLKGRSKKGQIDIWLSKTSDGKERYITESYIRERDVK